MDRMWRVVIAEDHTILREGLRSLLENESEGYSVVGEAADGLNAIRLVEEEKPDLLLIDLSMPKMNGLSAIAEIKKRCPKTKILALTVHKEEEYILEAFRSGSDGYCLKDADHTELKHAIECVLTGKPFFSPEISEKVLEGYLEGRRTLKSETSWDTLTQRERDVLKLIGEGYKNKQIAEYLCISPKTVEKHRANIMNKLNLHNAASLTSYAIEKGLVTR
ncbi:MAG TPA: response regulator transcription factor [Thermodesulfobacteriota bacterium]|nr:response regulator transcription factor [Deltaproteobacteria bacterium]HNR12285.1 response regulator transcription factor [Thermodesulfobacteriota bacterium]HNU72510.1 response regulator transcription factor [Thermodesulfobacteriota bacterium]HQO78310.1 response regulator transcription factor [Thermodesulfobacteriota bacterium]